MLKNSIENLPGDWEDPPQRQSNDSIARNCYSLSSSTHRNESWEGKPECSTEFSRYKGIKYTY